ncbi:MAG: bifunctional ADP-dependent NAD(P)H-hydrate dehydratase/NAD(P)H-hydrate epimerase, partial [Boseongicola sp.]|nr:bifunctional ADP-dependent NAD(P)H-hydrate dehydratase/NAD(P)H-hydrate epimerase [Boseongicola sp.]
TDVWIDAVFGIGLTRPLPDVVIAAFTSIATECAASKLIAVDILSGIDADTGTCLTKLPVTPDLTVTFHAPKVGHLTGEGANLTGQLIVKDIGL